MTDQLGWIILKGTGIFSLDNFQIESPFVLQRQFSHTFFQIEGYVAADTFASRSNGFWKLSGHLEDGRVISANSLQRTNVKLNIGIDGSEGSVELEPHTDVILGQENSLSLLEVRYPLVGMFDGKFSIEDSGWTIEILDSSYDSAATKKRSMAWKIPLEGQTLRLSCKQKTLEEYDEKAREIMMLLSLALGNGVTSYRRIVSSESLGLMEIWTQMTGDEIGPGPIVPVNFLEQFLSQALPVWQQWKPDKKDEVRLAITYINLSATGYLDTRLFQMSQVWEFLAKSWICPGELNDHESDLRSRVKASYREWKKENPEADPKGTWGGRITFPFQWPIAKQQMESLAENRKIDLSKIGLDLDALKGVRDSVAHTGKMKTQVNEERDNTYQLLAAAQFGLKLILVAELGYSGSIVTSKEGWKTTLPIENYLRN